MLLRQTLPYPIDGYWDGGKKQVFEWTVDNKENRDSRGIYVRVGSWIANHWFYVAKGKTEKLTLSYAKYHLSQTALGKQSKFEYIQEEEQSESVSISL